MRYITILFCLFLFTTVSLAQDETTPYQQVLDQIETARVAGRTSLNLQSWNLTALPPEIGQLTNLKWLALDNNDLENLPPEIGQLTSLQRLYLKNNNLVTLPPEIGQLTNLRELRLENNNLVALPPEIGQLTNLNQLHLENNAITAFPPEMGRLNSHMGVLAYIGNPLAYPPAEIRHQGTHAILEYLRAEANRHEAEKLRLIWAGVAGIGLLVALLQGFRLKQRGQRKPKKKRGLAA